MQESFEIEVFQDVLEWYIAVAVFHGSDRLVGQR